VRPKSKEGLTGGPEDRGIAFVSPVSWDLGSIGNVTSFGEDAAHELYVTSTNGKVYCFAPAE
jgi:hypothetical protein